MGHSCGFAKFCAHGRLDHRRCAGRIDRFAEHELWRYGAGRDRVSDPQYCDRQYSGTALYGPNPGPVTSGCVDFAIGVGLGFRAGGDAAVYSVDDDRQAGAGIQFTNPMAGYLVERYGKKSLTGGLGTYFRDAALPALVERIALRRLSPGLIVLLRLPQLRQSIEAVVMP